MNSWNHLVNLESCQDSHQSLQGLKLQSSKKKNFRWLTSPCNQESIERLRVNSREHQALNALESVCNGGLDYWPLVRKPLGKLDTTNPSPPNSPDYRCFVVNVNSTNVGIDPTLILIRTNTQRNKLMVGNTSQSQESIQGLNVTPQLSTS